MSAVAEEVAGFAWKNKKRGKAGPVLVDLALQGGNHYTIERGIARVDMRSLELYQIHVGSSVNIYIPATEPTRNA